MTAYDLGTIAAAGGGIIVDARKYSAYDMGTVVKKATSTIIVRNATHYSAYDCKSIATQNPGKVIFDFAD